MASGREYSKHQKKIIEGYYEHRDTIALQALAEIVSDLYLAETEKAKAELWKKAELALKKLKPNAAQLAAVMQTRDVAKLAQLVGDLQS